MSTSLPVPVPGILDTFSRKISRGLSHYLCVYPFVMNNSEPLVSFTFDDVPDSAYKNGAPLLEQHGARGTFFVSGGLCGTTHSDWRLMSAADCADLYRRGHEIGCHTFSHRAAQDVNARQMEEEIARNRAFFKSVSRDLVLETFAYPYGSVSPARKRQLHRYFRACRGVKSQINAGQLDLGLLASVALMDSKIDTIEIDRLLRETRRRNGWLIFFTHDVKANPTPLGCTPELLDYAIAGATMMGTRVLTAREALNCLEAQREAARVEHLESTWLQ